MKEQMEPDDILENEKQKSKLHRKDKETAQKMRVLWVILFILIALLIVAAVYEIVLGNGSKETGSMRMSGTAAESDISEDEDKEQDFTSPEPDDTIKYEDEQGQEQDLVPADEEPAEDQEQDSLTEDGEEGSEMEPAKSYVAGNDGSDGKSPVVTLAGLGT